MTSNLASSASRENCAAVSAAYIENDAGFLEVEFPAFVEGRKGSERNNPVRMRNLVFVFE